MISRGEAHYQEQQNESKNVYERAGFAREAGVSIKAGVYLDIKTGVENNIL